MNAEELHSFLKQLPTNEFPNGATFVAKAITQFVQILGYDEPQIYFETALGAERRYRADVIVASERTGQPWILIEAKLPRRNISQKRVLQLGLKELRTYITLANPMYALLFSPELLLIIHEGNEERYDLEHLTLEEAYEIFALLKNPGTLPLEKVKYPEETALPKDVIEFETFRLDRAKYSELLQAALSAQTNDEKGKTLEELAAFLFSSMSFLKIKYRNLQTTSSEIDLVVQNEGWHKSTIFDEFNRYFLVECKNWQDSVGANQVRDFKGKLEKSKIRLGFLFAKNGVTGAHAGADALLEIHSAFDARNIFIVVISEEDLKAVEVGVSFYDILDEKLDHLRFSL